MTPAEWVADSSAVSAETVIHTSNNTPIWRNGRTYAVQMVGRFSGSGSSGATLRLRKGNTTGGALLCDFGVVILPSNFTYAAGPMLLANNSGADITSQVCATIQSGAGTVQWLGTTTSPRGFYVIDVGAYSDFNGLAPVAFIT
jgi:hypothetical protein